MLGTWRTHAEYQTYLLAKLALLEPLYSRSIQDFSTTIIKMWLLNLDQMKPIVSPLFSPIGRPSNQQPELMRFAVLMADQREHDVDRWLKTVAATPLFCALVGLEPHELPGASTFRDFISRLWQDEPPNPMKPPKKRPKEGFGKEKQPPKRPGIIAELCRRAKRGEVFGGIPEAVLQAIFTQIALKPSELRGLLGNSKNLKVSADGTCVESHAYPNGRKICDCHGRCECDRRHSDPEATWGWDSYHERYFYGYNLYMLSTHNADIGLDLPVYLRFTDACQFDGVTLIEAFAHARSLYQGFLNFEALIADNAHDNYATYDLLRHFRVRPFIDLNPRNAEGGQPMLQNIQLSRNGIPICADGHEMLNWGFDRNKFRTKFRAPCVLGKVTQCPYREQCCKTLYGKITYLRHVDNLRLFPPISRGSDEWISIYNERTAAERVNNRILTDYLLERPKRYGKKKLAFFAFINALNVHLDAQAKHGNTTLLDLAA